MKINVLRFFLTTVYYCSVAFVGSGILCADSKETTEIQAGNTSKHALQDSSEFPMVIRFPGRVEEFVEKGNEGGGFKIITDPRKVQMLERLAEEVKRFQEQNPPSHLSRPSEVYIPRRFIVDSFPVHHSSKAASRRGTPHKGKRKKPPHSK